MTTEAEARNKENLGLLLQDAMPNGSFDMIEQLVSPGVRHASGGLRQPIRGPRRINSGEGRLPRMGEGGLEAIVGSAEQSAHGGR